MIIEAVTAVKIIEYNYLVTENLVWREKENDDRCFLDCAILVHGYCNSFYRRSQNENIISLNSENMLTLILYLAGIAGFALFFRFIDWFEKI